MPVNPAARAARRSDSSNFGGMNGIARGHEARTRGAARQIALSIPARDRRRSDQRSKCSESRALRVHTVDGQLRIAFEARADAAAITEWRKLPNPNVASGVRNFAGEYRIRPGSSEAPVLAVKSDLVGVEARFTGAARQERRESRPSTLTMTFAPDHTRMDVQLGERHAGLAAHLPSGVRSGSDRHRRGAGRRTR